MYESLTDEKSKGYKTDQYYVPAGSLGFSVCVFSIVAIVCIIILLIRRKLVGGELGGSQNGRMFSAALLTSLWLLYIFMSILQAYNVGGLGEVQIGVDQTIKNPNAKCNK